MKKILTMKILTIMIALFLVGCAKEENNENADILSKYEGEWSFPAATSQANPELVIEVTPPPKNSPPNTPPSEMVTFNDGTINVTGNEELVLKGKFSFMSFGKLGPVSIMGQGELKLNYSENSKKLGKYVVLLAKSKIIEKDSNISSKMESKFGKGRELSIEINTDSDELSILIANPSPSIHMASGAYSGLNSDKDVQGILAVKHGGMPLKFSIFKKK